MVQRFPGGLRVAEVALEDGGAATEDLAFLRDADLGVGEGRAYGLEAYVAVPVHDRDPRHLGLAVELLQVDAHGVKESEDVRPQRRAAGVRPAHPVQAQLVADRPEDQPVGQAASRSRPSALGPAREARVGRRAARLHRPAVGAALEGRGVLGHHLHVRHHLLPDAGRRHDRLGSDLAQVLAHGLRLLGEVDHEPDRERRRHRHHLLADPRQGQERHVVVVGRHRVGPLQLVRHRQEVGVGEHRQLGPAGGAGGRAQEGDVVGLDRRHLAGEGVRRAGVGFGAQGFHGLEAGQAGRLVAVHSPVVVVDDVLQLGQPVPHFQHLVHLLLVLGDHDPGRRRLQQPRQLRRHGVLVQPQGEGAQALGRQLGDRPLGPVVAHDCDAVALADAQRVQSQGEAPDPVQVARPGDLLPDAELLLAQGDAARGPLGVADQEAREGVGGGGRPVAAHAAVPSCRPR